MLLGSLDRLSDGFTDGLLLRLDEGRLLGIWDAIGDVLGTVEGSELKEGVELCITDGSDEGASLGLAVGVLEGASLGVKLLLGIYDGEVLGIELG